MVASPDSTRPTDGDAAVTTTAQPTEGAATSQPVPTSQEAPVPEPSSLSIADWVEAWSEDPADVLVIGDGYTNLPSQWIQLWGERVADDRPVTIRHWGEAADQSFNSPIVLSGDEDDSLSIWSAGRADTTIEAAAERVDGFVGASTTPDAVLISLGMSSEDEDVSTGMDALLEDLPAVPLLVVLGPNDLYDAQVLDALREWVASHEERVTLVDLADRAPDSPSAEEWAQSFDEAIDRDG